MSYSFRPLVKDFLLYGAGDLVLKAFGFISLPILTRLFVPADYGVWAFVTTAVSVLGAFLALGGDSAYARFYFEARDHEARQRLTSTWFSFLAIWSVGLVVLIIPFSGFLADFLLNDRGVALLFILALLGAPLALMSAMCSQVLRNRFRPMLFVGLNAGTAALSLGVGIAAALAGYGVAGVLAGGLVGAAMFLPLRLWLIRDLLRPTFSRTLLRQLLGYGVPLVPAALAYWVFQASDRLVIAKLAGLEATGIYAIAASLTSILVFANGALGQAWSPHAFQAYAADENAARRSYGRVLTYILVLFGFLAVGFTAFAREAILILATPAYLGAAVAVGPLALALVGLASTQITAAGISITKRTYWFAIFAWIAALLNLALNFLLIPRWGIAGSAWAMTASYLFITTGYAIVSQRLWPVHYELRKTLVAAAVTVVFVVLVPALPVLDLVASIILKGVYCIAFLALLFVVGVLGRREITLLRGLRRPHSSPETATAFSRVP